MAKCKNCGEKYRCPCDACTKHTPSKWACDEDFNVTCICGVTFSEEDAWPMQEQIDKENK